MSSRKVRKVLLSYEMVSLDKEEFEEEDRKLTTEFEHDFELELLYLKDQEKPVAIEELPFEPQEVAIPEIDPEDAALPSLLKPLHRQLVAALHPDINGNEFLDRVQQFQVAWDSGDFGFVISMALSLRISVELSEEAMKALEDRVGRLNVRISSGKKTARWFWGSSQKSDNNRQAIVRSLGIDANKFEIWKAERASKPKNSEINSEESKKIRMLTVSR
jgi:hypothetical protein